jgi:phenylalanine-4-hydroxylase
LFVTKSFPELTLALDEFANTMAFRRGGVYGLELAKRAENTATVVFENGIQVSGIVSDFQTDAEGAETLITLSGTKQISFHDRAADELANHVLGSKISIPLFERNVISASLGDLTRKLHGSGLHTKGGHRILGRFKKELALGTHGKILILENAKIVGDSGEILFEEKTRPYPLILATKVTSVFGGAADRARFAARGQHSKKVASHKTNLTEETIALNELYQRVRDFREEGQTTTRLLESILHELNKVGPNDWLLRLELLELFKLHNPNSVFTAQLRQKLNELSQSHPQWADMIDRGIELV